MTFSYNAVWDDTGRLLRAHGALLAAIAGVFVFLPTLLVGHFLPPPEMPDGMELREHFRIFFDYLKQNSLWLVLQSFLIMAGSAAMLRLALAPRVTVAGAIRFGLVLLPAYSILSVMTNLMVIAGLLLLIVPGLYLWGRVLPAAPAMVAEERRNPIDALKRGFALSAGHGWAIVGLVLLVMIPGAILAWVIEKLTGIALILAAGQELGKMLTAVVYCALNAMLTIVLVMLSAAIYSALAAPEAKGPDLKKTD